MKDLTGKPLIQALDLDRLASLAIIGMGKNAGKTTVLNHLVQACHEGGLDRVLAVTSIGRDGEEEDLVTGGVKPRIYLRKGQLLATAWGSLAACDAVLEILAMTGIYTATGEVVLARTRSNGYVELAGPSLASDIGRCQTLFRQLEPDCLMIVDGALSRKAAAGGGLTQAVLLVAGMANAPSLEALVEKTARQVALLRLKPFDESLRQAAQRVIDQEPGCRALIMNGAGGVRRTLTLATLAGQGPEIAKALEADDRLLLLRGALTLRLVEGLLECPYFSKMTLAAEDGTRFFLDERSLARLKRRQVALSVLHEMTLPMVLVNPRRSDGSLADSKALVQALAARIDLPVADLGPALL